MLEVLLFGKLFMHFDFILWFILFFMTVNMALHRPTFQLNTLSKYPSSRLVDGKKSNLHLNGDQCSSTMNYQCYAMWRVDLMNTRRIERIVVYSRTDNLEWGKKKVNVKLQMQTWGVTNQHSNSIFNQRYMSLISTQNILRSTPHLRLKGLNT